MGEETLEKNKTPNSDTSGASGSRPQSVPQPEEFFMQNLRAFRSYVYEYEGEDNE